MVNERYVRECNVIKLLQLLKEVISAERKCYSWQRPNGMFIPIKYSHGSDAVPFTGDVKDPIMSAWKQGYMRIVHIGDYIVAHNEVVPPNDKQTKALIDLAMETGDTYVEYDGGNNSKILWSSYNTLE